MNNGMSLLIKSNDCSSINGRAGFLEFKTRKEKKEDFHKKHVL